MKFLLISEEPEFFIKILKTSQFYYPFPNEKNLEEPIKFLI